MAISAVQLRRLRVPRLVSVGHPKDGFTVQENDTVKEVKK
jgi:hypothetical protein